MKKIPDWEISFDAYLNRNMHRPFEWGKWDCVMFMCGFIKAMTKRELKPKSWTWSSEEEAMQCILKYGKGKGLAEGISNAVDRQKGIKEIRPEMVTKGDFGVYREENDLACVFDNYSALGVNTEGLVVKNEVEIVRAWRIYG
jgi:hypothetical protein|tara:strand:- start:254 stop:679 length:426 start_codon:yes stop_codon:yes gene_type:complete